MSNAPPSYYFRSSPSVEPQGPVHLSTLKHRAALGDIDGSTQISKHLEGPWSSADQIKALELEWQIEDENGRNLPVCHVLALRGKIEREEIQPFWEIIHLPTGEDYHVVDALCSALLEQNRLLEARLQAGAPAVADAADAAEDDASPRELRLRRDQAVREASKWKRLYDDELERNRSRETELLEEIEELRAWQRKAAERIKSLQRRRDQLEGLIQQPLDTSSGEQDRDLSRAYQELQMQLEYLMDSLQLRVREVEEVREQNQELSLQISQTRKDLESTLSSQEEVHAETLKHLATLEQAHTDLIREYRDLNHRFIQFRHQGTSPAPAAPPPTDGSATPPSPDTTPLDMS